MGEKEEERRSRESQERERERERERQEEGGRDLKKRWLSSSSSFFSRAFRFRFFCGPRRRREQHTQKKSSKPKLLTLLALASGVFFL